jgi:hypothetical protein
MAFIWDDPRQVAEDTPNQAAQTTSGEPDGFQAGTLPRLRRRAFPFSGGKFRGGNGDELQAGFAHSRFARERRDGCDTVAAAL